MYIQDQQLNGWLQKAAASVKSAVKSTVQIATAPLKIASAGIRGQSMAKAAEAQILRPAMNLAQQAAPIMNFVPGVGTLAANLVQGAVVLDALRRQRNEAKAAARDASAIEAEIAATERKIAALKVQQAGAPVTQSQIIGAQSAAQLPQITQVIQPAQAAQPAQSDTVTKKPVNWPIIISGAVAAITLLK